MPRRNKRPQARSFGHLRASYRSGLEAGIAALLLAAGVPAQFESFRIPFTQPEKSRNYTPDFLLPNGIILETKGLLTSADRQKHVWVKEQHPELDIRFVFQNAKAKIAKGSKTTYADWADKVGIPWAHKTIPQNWLTEETDGRSKAAVDRLVS